MAKRIIRFPMKMKNGTEVRTIEELRENFDMRETEGVSKAADIKGVLFNKVMKMWKKDNE